VIDVGSDDDHRFGRLVRIVGGSEDSEHVRAGAFDRLNLNRACDLDIGEFEAHHHFAFVQLGLKVFEFIFAFGEPFQGERIGDAHRSDAGA